MFPVMPDRNTHGGQFRHPAQVKITFSGTMEIRATRGQKSQTLGMLRKHQGLFRRMARSNNLDCFAAKGAKFEQQFLQCALAQLVASGMRNDGPAAASANP